MKIQRTFFLGDEWLYYKIYCGARSSDFILNNAIYSLVQKLTQHKYIDKWFFIRYNDPDYHLRVRFLLTDNKNIGEVITTVHKFLRSYVEEYSIHTIQCDTYTRELERYGNTNIELSETLFYLESNLILKAKDLIKDDTKYFLFIIKLIDQFLSCLHYSSNEKLMFTSQNKQPFWLEFEGNKILTRQLNKKYKSVEILIVEILSNSNNNKEYDTIFKLAQAYLKESKPIVEQISTYSKDKTLIEKNTLISSYIHMFINRAFRSKQRFHELICYHFLEKHFLKIKHIK